MRVCGDDHKDFFLATLEILTKKWPGDLVLLLIVIQEFMVIKQSLTSDTSTYVRRKYDLFLWTGMEILNQLFPI